MIYLICYVVFCIVTFYLIRISESYTNDTNGDILWYLCVSFIPLVNFFFFCIAMLDIGIDPLFQKIEKWLHKPPKKKRWFWF